MADHYYTSRPESSHDLREIRATLRGYEYRFQTDAGVFSKEHIDRGTRLLLEALKLESVQSMLDLGCGYGPVGIIVAKEAPNARVAMVDPNERAVELSRSNARLNQVEVDVRQGEGCRPFAGESFDLIATNPPIRAGKRVVFDLVDQAYDALKPGGKFYAVIRTQQGAASLARWIEEVFGAVQEPEKGGGFRVLLGIK